MKKINYISIEIRSDGKNDIFTTDYDLMFETDEQVCIKHGEKLEILTLKKDTLKIHSQLEDIHIYFRDWDFLKYKAIHCSTYTTKDLTEVLEEMKKKITKFIHKEYDWLFGKDIEDRINSITLETRQ